MSRRELKTRLEIRRVWTAVWNSIQQHPEEWELQHYSCTGHYIHKNGCRVTVYRLPYLFMHAKPIHLYVPLPLPFFFLSHPAMKVYRHIRRLLKTESGIVDEVLVSLNVEPMKELTDGR